MHHRTPYLIDRDARHYSPRGPMTDQHQSPPTSQILHRSASARRADIHIAGEGQAGEQRSKTALCAAQLPSPSTNPRSRCWISSSSPVHHRVAVGRKLMVSADLR